MYDSKNIIYADNLKVYFPVLGGVFKRKLADLKAVDGVSFSIEKGKTLGIVGESGSGKTTLGRCLIKLVEANSGSVIFEPRRSRAMPVDEAGENKLAEGGA